MSKFFRILFFALLLLQIGCNKKFNSRDWKNTTQEDNLIKNNDKNLMIDDLVKSELLIGKSSKEVKILLGKANFYDSQKNSFQYETFEDFGWNIDPKFYRGIEIYFNEDSIVTSTKIYEIKNKIA